MPGGGGHAAPWIAPSNSAPTRAEPGQTGGCRNIFQVGGVEMVTPSKVCVVQPAGTEGFGVTAGALEHEHKTATTAIGAMASLRDLQTTVPRTLQPLDRFGQARRPRSV